jgi:hypothetical protein
MKKDTEPLEKPKEKYDKPISFYPLKPEDVLSAFMKVNPEKLKEKKA